MPRLSDIVAALGLEPRRHALDPDIDGVASLSEATPRHIAFLTSDAYLKDLNSTRASAVIVPRRVALPDGCPLVVLPVEDAELGLAKVLELFAHAADRPAPGVDAAAKVDPSAKIGDDVAIGPFVVIGARTRIGRGCIIHPGAQIGTDVVVGDECVIHSHVVVRERVTVGRRVILHAGAVIGTDGFGYRWDGSRHAKVPHIGTVVIEDDVEIGSCTCIDRGKFGATRIGRGTKIDNLVQIAHNCVVGEDCVIAGQVGLAGSVVLGSRVLLGGQVAVSNHLRVGDGAMVAGRSGVATHIDADARVSGMPALPHRQTLREQGALRKLPELIAQARKLQDEIQALKQQLEGRRGE